MKKIGRFLKQNYKNIFILILGNFLVASASSFCFLNYQHGNFSGLLSGGVSGFTLILNEIFNGNLEVVAIIVSWILFIIGTIFLGLQFGLKTLFGTILFTGFLSLFTLPVFTNIQNEVNTLDPILASILGGMAVGTGCGIIYRIGGSTGGFDIPPLILNKYFKFKLSRCFFVQDGLLVLLALIAKFSLNHVLVGLISVFVCSWFVEITQVSGQKCYIAEIISDQYEAINQAILEKLDRGTTLFFAKGGYTQQDKVVIKVVIPKKQYHDLMQIVINADKNAFMSLQTTSDIFGFGFKRYE